MDRTDPIRRQSVQHGQVSRVVNYAACTRPKSTRAGNNGELPFRNAGGD